MFSVPDETTLTPEASNVTRNSICIVVRKGRFGVRRKADTAAMSVDADKTLTALSKCILESPELQDVVSLDGEVARYLKSICLRSMFRGGVYLVPIGLVVEANDVLSQLQARREELVAKAVETFPVRVQETSERLRVLNDPRDYPSEAEFKSKFYFDWQFVTWETPTQLRQIKASLFEAEAAKAAAKLSAVADDCRDAMRAGMSQLVDHLVEKLTPDPDGKRKIFGDSIIKNFDEFFRTFEMRNITDDADLAALVRQAKSLLHGVAAKDIRKDQALRDAMVAQFGQLKTQLVPLTMDRGTREIVFDDSDAA